MGTKCYLVQNVTYGTKVLCIFLFILSFCVFEQGGVVLKPFLSTNAHCPDCINITSF
jgi:hypothetical protein